MYCGFEIQFGKQVARLYWIGHDLVFDRIYDGHEDNIIRHVFDDREDDPFKNHVVDTAVVTRLVHWGCTGRGASSYELAILTPRIKAIFAQRPVRILPSHFPL